MALAKYEHLDICRWGRLTNPVSKESGYFAWFTHKLATKNDSDETYDENNSFAYIVFAAGNKKWVYGEVEEEALVLRCDQKKGAFENAEKSTTRPFGRYGRTQLGIQNRHDGYGERTGRAGGGRRAQSRRG
jgi:hypothetical protein